MPKAKNNVTLNKPQKEMNKLEWLIQWFYKRWYFAIPVFLVLIVIGLGSFTDSIDSISSFCHKHFSKERPLFEKNDKRLKVLIIPVIEISQEGNLDIAYVIKKRLDSLNRVDKLNIVTHYYAERKVTQQFNEDSANFLLEHENADLIIYGDYSNQSEIGHEFSISYQTSKSLNTIEEEFKNKFGEYKTGT